MKHYRIYPGTVPADKKSVVTIKPEGSYDIFEASEGLHLLYSPVEWQPEIDNGGLEQKLDIILKNGQVSFDLLFNGEQEHYFQLKNSRGQNVCTFSIYSLKPDLYGMLPLVKGMPVALTDHLSRHPKLKLLKGKVGKVYSWILDDDEKSSLQEHDRVLTKLPKAVIVHFPGE